MYETETSSQSDFETGTLTAMMIGGGHSNQAGGDNHTATTSTATLIDSSHASSGRDMGTFLFVVAI